jgi:hypothetical protein
MLAVSLKLLAAAHLGLYEAPFSLWFDSPSCRRHFITSQGPGTLTETTSKGTSMAAADALHNAGGANGATAGAGARRLRSWSCYLWRFFAWFHPKKQSVHTFNVCGFSE